MSWEFLGRIRKIRTITSHDAGSSGFQRNTQRNINSINIIYNKVICTHYVITVYVYNIKLCNQMISGPSTQSIQS